MHEGVHALMSGYSMESPEYREFAAVYEQRLKLGLEDIRVAKMSEIDRDIVAVRSAVNEDAKAGYLNQLVADEFLKRLDKVQKSLHEKNGLNVFVHKPPNSEHTVGYVNPNKHIIGDLAIEIFKDPGWKNVTSLKATDQFTLNMYKYLDAEYSSISEGAQMPGLIAREQGHPYEDPGETASSMISLGNTVPKQFVTSVGNSIPTKARLYAQNYVTLVNLFKANDPDVMQQMPNVLYVYEEMKRIA